MDWLEILLVLIIGVIAGFANTVAGGGSLLTVPVLIFLGLESVVANATNRVAILFQNIFAVRGFKSKGVDAFPYAYYLAGSALIGSIIGAKIAVEIKGEVFNRILAIVMVLVIVITIFKPFKNKHGSSEKLDKKSMIIGILSFFFVGIYGGFIQAGVGFFIIAVLGSVNNFSLVKTNSAKVFVILIYSISAIVVFIYEDVINWEYGLTLAIGNSTGGWFGSRWQVDKGDKWIRIFLVVAVSLMAIKLWFF
ncbi:MAG: sulfite exporter TauE/SafE family protein [Bacteroidetes bacterium]|nr:sulfite exporter TauE/SafE family protein [Bacteroidota bacterium]MDA1119109.1 sulfite exporter TauE/SafE family protein [Bacteroidota bacterium]